MALSSLSALRACQRRFSQTPSTLAAVRVSRALELRKDAINSSAATAKLRLRPTSNELACTYGGDSSRACLAAVMLSGPLFPTPGCRCMRVSSGGMAARTSTHKGSLRRARIDTISAGGSKCFNPFRAMRCRAGGVPEMGQCPVRATMPQKKSRLREDSQAAAHTLQAVQGGDIPSRIVARARYTIQRGRPVVARLYGLVGCHVHSWSSAGLQPRSVDPERIEWLP